MEGGHLLDFRFSMHVRPKTSENYWISAAADGCETATFGEAVYRSLTLVNDNSLLSRLRCTFHQFQKTLSGHFTHQ